MIGSVIHLPAPDVAVGNVWREADGALLVIELAGFVYGQTGGGAQGYEGTVWSATPYGEICLISRWSRRHFNAERRAGRLHRVAHYGDVEFANAWARGLMKLASRTLAERRR